MLGHDVLTGVRTFGGAGGTWGRGRGRGRETLPAAGERMRSAVRDFVAESTFGPGQQRH